MARSVTVLVIALVAATAVAQTPLNCKYKSITNHSYDLSALTIPDGHADYRFPQWILQRVYHANPCGTAQGGCNPATSFCLQTNVSSVSLGDPTTARWDAITCPQPAVDVCGVVVTYDQGDTQFCPFGISRAVTVNFECSSVQEFSQIQEIPAGSCSYVIIFKSPNACPTDLPLCNTHHNQQDCQANPACQWCQRTDTVSGCLPIMDTCDMLCSYNSTNGYQFDLSRLTHAPGLADYNFDKYHFNPCGYTSYECVHPTPACYENDGTHPVFMGDIASASWEDSYNCEGCGATLNYDMGEGLEQRSAILRFQCSQHEYIEHATKVDNVETVVTWLTPQACPQNLVKCFQLDTADKCHARVDCHYCPLADVKCLPLGDPCSPPAICAYSSSTNQYQYNLHNLIRPDGEPDYQFVGLSGDSQLTYYFNPCSFTSWPCDGAVGPGCVTLPYPPYDTNLGMLGSQEFADSLNCEACGVRVSYRGGSTDGCGPEGRRLSVDFQCSAVQSNEFYYAEDTDDCNFRFVFKTPEACPRNLPACGTLNPLQCNVRNDCVWCGSYPRGCIPIADSCTACTFDLAPAGMKYDFGPLAKQLGEGDYSIVSDSWGTYYFNPCGPVHHPCGFEKTPACQAAKIPVPVDYALGRLDTAVFSPSKICDGCGATLQYTLGSYCDGGTTRRNVTINMICSDYEIGLEKAGTGHGNCLAEFTFRSHHACPKDKDHAPCRVHANEPDCSSVGYCTWCHGYCAPKADGCKQCGFVSPNGNIYDLSHSKMWMNGSDYQMYTGDSFYYYQPCGVTQYPCRSDTPLCQIASNPPPVPGIHKNSLGVPINVTFQPSTHCDACGFTIQYLDGGGDDGSAELCARSAEMQFSCAQHHYGMMSVKQTSQLCHFAGDFRSPLACPTNVRQCWNITDNRECLQRADCQWCSNSYGFTGVCKPGMDFCFHDMDVCKFRNPNTNDVYDLTSLRRHTGLDYKAFGADNGTMYTYYFHVCGLSMSPPAIPCYTNTGVLPSVCRVATGAQNLVAGVELVGSIASADFFPLPSSLGGQGVVIEYRSTTSCPNAQLGFTKRTQLVFLCDLTALTPTISQVEITGPDSASNNCVYRIRINSAAACPVGWNPNNDSGLGGGAIFAIVFFTLFGSYCFLGCAYNRYRGKAGPDLIPNVTFWSTLCLSLSDGCRNLGNKLRRAPANAPTTGSSDSDTHNLLRSSSGYGAVALSPGGGPTVTSDSSLNADP